MYYSIHGKKIIATRNLIQWARWYETARRQCIIDQTNVRDAFVSTVFLGLDHGFKKHGKPILFETMVFEQNGAASLVCRTHSRKIAKIVHAAVVISLKRKPITKQSRITKFANERVYYSTRNAGFKVRSTGLSNTVFRPRKKRHAGFPVFRSAQTTNRNQQ